MLHFTSKKSLLCYLFVRHNRIPKNMKVIEASSQTTLKTNAFFWWTVQSCFYSSASLHIKPAMSSLDSHIFRAVRAIWSSFHLDHAKASCWHSAAYDGSYILTPRLAVPSRMTVVACPSSKRSAEDETPRPSKEFYTLHAELLPRASRAAYPHRRSTYGFPLEDICSSSRRHSRTRESMLRA